MNIEYWRLIYRITYLFAQLGKEKRPDEVEAKVCLVAERLGMAPIDGARHLVSKATIKVMELNQPDGFGRYGEIDGRWNVERDQI